MNLRDLAVKKLNDRGVSLESIAHIVYNLQKPYHDDVSMDICLRMVNEILDKRECVYTVLTGIAIDEIAEKGLIEKEICDLITEDNKLYGVDEILALGITNVFGSIALTNFGYLDKTKPDIIGVVDNLGKEKKGCYTFLDDIICAIASSAASRLAHYKGTD